MVVVFVLEFLHLSCAAVSMLCGPLFLGRYPCMSFSICQPSNVLSTASPVLLPCCVSQGSIIGPLFLILYVNDLTDHNLSHYVGKQYADDTTISAIFSDVSERHTLQGKNGALQGHLNEFMRWAAKWKLQITEHKSWSCLTEMFLSYYACCRPTLF